MNPRVVAEVDLAAIRHNISEIRTLVGLRVDVMPVVKADGYGHGAAEVARAALQAGAEWLGVATVAEALALRKSLPGATICVFSPFDYEEAEEIVVNRLVPFVGDPESARQLSRCAQKLRSAARMHIEVDTGMGRGGVLADQAGRLAGMLARLPATLVTGLMTHFPCAETDPEFTRYQIALFERARTAVLATDTQLKHLHSASSAAILRYPEARLNMVRPGLLTYGILPDLPADVPVPPLKPALRLRTSVAMVRDLPQDHTIGYGRTRVLTRPSRVAIIPIGYGDGYPRALSNVGSVLIAGQRASILGRVCMDMVMVDVTDIPAAQVGSEVVLIGTQGEARISVEEIAKLISTTEHDVTTRLTSRVPRVYLGGK